MGRVASTDISSRCSSARPAIIPCPRPVSAPAQIRLSLTRHHPLSLERKEPMKAVCWMGKENMQVLNVPDPKILNPRDAILRITTTCICGSDLHLYDGYVPTLEQGDILGHEFMGEVVEVGPAVNKDKLKVGDRVVVPFTISCGNCFPCKDQLWSCCDNSNPNAWIAEKMMGYSPSGLFGCTPVPPSPIRRCFMRGAGRVIAIDRIPERLEMARAAGAETINFEETDVVEALHERTGNQGR